MTKVFIKYISGFYFTKKRPQNSLSLPSYHPFSDHNRHIIDPAPPLTNLQQWSCTNNSIIDW